MISFSREARSFQSERKKEVQIQEDRKGQMNGAGQIHSEGELGLEVAYMQAGGDGEEREQAGCYEQMGRKDEDPGSSP